MLLLKLLFRIVPHIAFIQPGKNRFMVSRKLGPTHIVESTNKDIIGQIQKMPAHRVQRAVDCTGVRPCWKRWFLENREKAAAAGAPPPGTRCGIEILQERS